MAEKIRADQVGSLLRPAVLLEARAAHSPQLRSQEDAAILEALEMQSRIGLDILSDGEMRRGSWLTEMADSVEGFVPERVTVNWKGPGGGPEGSTAHAAAAELRKLRKLASHELPLLQQAAAGKFKITLPAPSNFLAASYKPGLTDKAYATRQDFLDDLVEIIRDEVEWLVAEGVAYVQFDAPYYSRFIDPVWRERSRQSGRDPDRDLESAVAGDNAAFAGVPRDRVTLALHICRGNSRSRWMAEGGYEAIAGKLFGTLDVDRFLLEFDNDRAGSFEPLRLVPPGKDVVLGLITTKEPALEPQGVLLRRIDQAARYVPLENLAVSTQCGFASVAAGNLLSVDEQWRKLELVVETARKVWG